MSFLSFLGFDKMAKDGADVLKFPQSTSNPYIEPPAPKPTTVFYRLGVTSNNTVSFGMGQNEILLSKEGVENLIAQLAVFRDTLDQEDNDVPPDNDPNGGLPAFEEQPKKAA
jgi:hypothetical protein